MDEQSGAIVQIDFGMTFGIGASMLPVPELISCRVSPQVSHPIIPQSWVESYDITTIQTTKQSQSIQTNQHTLQLCGALRPLDGKGLLRHYMSQALGALRNDEATQAVCNALELYVNDPVVDW